MHSYTYSTTIIRQKAIQEELKQAAAAAHIPVDGSGHVVMMASTPNTDDDDGGDREDAAHTYWLLVLEQALLTAQERRGVLQQEVELLSHRAAMPSDAIESADPQQPPAALLEQLRAAADALQGVVVCCGCNVVVFLFVEYVVCVCDHGCGVSVVVQNNLLQSTHLSQCITNVCVYTNPCFSQEISVLVLHPMCFDHHTTYPPCHWKNLYVGVWSDVGEGVGHIVCGVCVPFSAYTSLRNTHTPQKTYTQAQQEMARAAQQEAAQRSAAAEEASRRRQHEDDEDDEEALAKVSVWERGAVR